MLEEDIQRSCAKCLKPINEESRYCSHCGTSQVSETLFHHHNNKLTKLKQAAVFYAIEVIICLVYGFTESLQTLAGLTAFHVVSAINVLCFIFLNKHNSNQVFGLSTVSSRKLILFVLLTIPASLMVSFLANKINILLYSTNTNYFDFFIIYNHGKWLMLLYIAVLPALFEELAYRGYLLEVLKEVVDEKQAVFISAFLFAIIHLSFLSLFWLLPFALLLGYIRMKEKTIWYGIAIHFTFNLTACLIDLI